MMTYGIGTRSSVCYGSIGRVRGSAIAKIPVMIGIGIQHGGRKCDS
ncbi:MAG: hypothetical protein BWY70_00435 [Bacteroidetes bacterium ADurb.Bin408]|nr:MAG: hypothetical protein BWY70_00435 [Bacteroidetes bacterium ADurb.Bin408]